MQRFRRSSRVLLLAGLLALAGLVAPAALAAAEGGQPLAYAMHGIEAFVLGLVEGLTEYLPVSSTGHLILAARALDIPDSPQTTSFLIILQAGAIAAVLWLYRRRVFAMIRGLFGGDPTGRRVAFAVGTAFLPAAVLGLLFGDWIKGHLFGLWPVTCAWFVGGVAILVVSWTRKGLHRVGSVLEAVTPRMAFLIGLWQCLALWPGTSRSLVTIVGGVLVGLSLPAAVEFSFLLGLATLGAATVYEAVEFGPVMLESFGAGSVALAFLTATVSAALAVRWLVAWISRHGLAVFGVYRVVLAVVVAGLLLLGVLEP